MPKVSVIVPIYNVGRFIRRCAESLLSQTLEDVEFLFVNDCTQDDSLNILKECVTRYPNRNVRIIEHEVNKGLPAARNTGLEAATGDYIFHCDSDDYVESTMLADLYGKVLADNADIVWCDWYLSFEKNERYMKQPDCTSAVEALRMMLTGRMKYNVWNKLVRRSLYEDNNVWFPSGYGMGEDMTMMMLFAFAKIVSYIPKAYYHYVKLNTNAFSNTYSNKHLDELRHNVSRMESFIRQKYGDSFDKEIGMFKLDVKYPFLITDNHDKYRLWESWYPEANDYILEKRNVGFRRDFLEKSALRHQFWIIWLYYKLVHKIIYGIIYR